jgi:hypothetical protein
MIVPAQDFDVVGVLMFVVLLIIGISLRKKETNASMVIVMIAILGLIADTYSVITNFIMGLH